MGGVLIYLKAEITEEAIEAIKTIVNHGNKAVIQRSGSGIIVMEEQRKIKYSNAAQSRG